MVKRHRAAAAVIAAGIATMASAQVKELGTGREVMWDMERIAVLGGGAKLTLHHPQQREISLVHDAPWEGNVCCYHTLLRLPRPLLRRVAIDISGGTTSRRGG